MRRAVLGCLAVLGALAISATTLAPAHAAISYESAQWRLNKLGCDAGPVNGRVNDHTRYAIVRFQAANRMWQTGKLSDSTRAKLADLDSAIACNKRPVPKNTGWGKRIVVSQKQNWVWLVNSDGTSAGQGGMIDNPDIVAVGTYYSGSKCGRPYKVLHNLDYSRKLQLDYFTRIIACGVGFHRIPIYVGTNTQIHPDWMLGTNAMTSHGCTRLSNYLAKKIYYFAPSGTKIVVVGDR